VHVEILEFNGLYSADIKTEENYCWSWM
jgi:hypothetical protein